jgi:hypothetical protein
VADGAGVGFHGLTVQNVRPGSRPRCVLRAQRGGRVLARALRRCGVSSCAGSVWFRHLLDHQPRAAVRRLQRLARRRARRARR